MNEQKIKWKTAKPNVTNQLHLDSIHTSELGEGWEAAVLDTEGEFDFIKEGQRTFHHSRSYYIGGTTSSSLNTYIDYSQYNLDNTGILKIYMVVTHISVPFILT